MGEKNQLDEDLWFDRPVDVIIVKKRCYSQNIWQLGIATGTRVLE